jgi:hypothetical protein
MKKQLQHMKLFLPALFIAIAFTSQAQQEFTLTTTTANVISSKALIDLPGLSGNPNAIIIAIPMDNTKTMNPHPTGAWYYSGKWNIFNCDQQGMPLYMTYKIQYYLNPGVNQFLHLVTQQNLGAEGSYIDNPALNNKANVQFSIFPNHSPDIRAGSWLNPSEAKTGYNSSTGRWYITNIGGQPMLKGCAYNVVVSSASSSTDPGNTSTGSCNCPSSLPPNGQATGDLAGMYPNPMVTKILNRPLSNTPPVISQVLKWNGTEWAPADDNVSSSSSIPLMKTFFKRTDPSVYSSVELSDAKPLHNFTDIKQSVVLEKRSRLIISATIRVFGPYCVYGCIDGRGDLFMKINNVNDLPSYIFDFTVQKNSKQWQIISNYMIDLDPGTYNIDFFTKHNAGSSPFVAGADYSSIIVIPL